MEEELDCVGDDGRPFVVVRTLETPAAAPAGSGLVARYWLHGVRVDAVDEVTFRVPQTGMLLRRKA